MNSKTGTPRLADLIVPAAVSVDLKASAKAEVLEELVGLLDAAGPLPDRAAALEAVLARERLGSTGCGSGVAVPHARIGGGGGAAVAVGLSRAGVDFGAVDHQPVRIFFLVLGPKDVPETTLKLLSQIARIIKQDEFRAALLAAQDSAAAAELLRGASDDRLI